MKRHLFIIAMAILMTTQVAFSQYQGAHAVSYRFVGVDTYSPYANVSDDGSLGFKFSLKDAPDDFQPAVEVGYFYGVKDWLAVGLPLRLGKIRVRDASVADIKTSTNYQDNLFVAADLRAKAALSLMEKQIILPYISTGFGVMKIEGISGIDMQIPIELGLDFRLARGFYLSTSTEYRLSFDELSDSNVNSFTNSMFHSAGIRIIMGDREDETPPPPPPVVEEPADADGDGVVDAEDTCPDVAGLAKFAGCPDTDGDDVQDSADDCPEVAGLAAFKGCPDTDSDGLADNKDECPTEAGPSSNNGCPIKVVDRDNDGVEDSADDCPDTPGTAKFNGCPDTDGDGVADKKDQCPSTPGIAKFNGCPDTDGDGVADKSDKCPTTKGTIANNGCPEIKQEDKATLNFATQAIEFETGSSTISTSSLAIMDQVAGIMAKYPNYSMSINGYTDSVGNDTNNLNLSKKRAKACHDYLVSKGISASRMTSEGYGEASPIADNATKEGRQRNRRVEFSIFLR